MRGAGGHNPWGQRLLALIVLGLSLVATFATWATVRNQESAAARVLFDRTVERARLSILTRVQSYEQVLRGAQGVFIASQHVDHDEWRAYVQSLELERSFPGIFGLAYIEHVRGPELEAFLASMRTARGPGFSVQPPGQRNEYLVVKYIEPEWRNAATIGTDVATLASRRDALELARDTGKPTFTGKLVLQSLGHEHGLVMYLPVYQVNTPTTAAERRALLRGYIAAPISLTSLLTDLRDEGPLNLGYEVFDGDSTDPQALLGSNVEGGARGLQTNCILALGNRVWTVRFTAGPALLGGMRSSSMLLLMSLVVSALLAGVVWSLLGTKERAQHLASNMTQKLREHEAELRKLAMVAARTDNGVIISDAQGQIEWVNQGFENLTGYCLDDVRGRKPGDFLQGPGTDPATIATMRQALAVGQGFEVELINYTRTGQRRWVALEVRPIHDTQGTLVNYIGLHRDVTQRTMTLEALRESERQFRQLAENISEVFWLTNRDATQIIYASPAFEKVWGRRVCDLMQDSDIWNQAIHPEDLPHLIKDWVAQFQNNDHAELEYRVIQPDGSIRWVRDQAFPVRDSQGNVDRIAGIAQDITEQRQVEQVERERINLQEALKAMDQVLGVVGHELRTPLAGLRAMSEFLLTDPDTDQTQNFLTAINQEVIRMADLVNNVLEAARLDSDGARWDWGPLSVMPLCREALDLVRPLVDANRITMAIAVKPRDLTMLGDVEALRRLIINLLTNAQKHTREGSITIEASQVVDDEGRWIELRFCDTGEGITDTIAQRLGTPFALNSGVVGAHYIRGTGLGLAICRGIVAAHGGTLSVASQPGKGSCFTARLRADLQTPAPANPNLSIIRETLR